MTMRRATLLPACLLAAAFLVAGGAVSDAAGARAPASHAASISLTATPNPSVASEPTLLAGRVTGSGAGDATVTLWRRGTGGHASMLAQVSADGNGSFVFTRTDAPLDANATIYASALGVRSRAVTEQVTAAVTLSAQTTGATSGVAVPLSGTVSPTGHAGETVLIQERGSTSWTTIAHATITPTGTFAVTQSFTGARAVVLRAVFNGDARNLAAHSDPLDLVVNAAQKAGLSLVASTDPILAGSSVTLSGTLASGASGQTVTLLAGATAQTLASITTTTTDGSGDFSFTEVPTGDTVYRVAAGHLQSTSVVVGVRPTVTLHASALTGSLGQTLSFGGTATGAAAGGGVSLQLLGDDGNFHTVARGTLAPGGAAGPAFSLSAMLTDPGARTYRVLVDDGSAWLGGVSGSITVAVGTRG